MAVSSDKRALKNTLFAVTNVHFAPTKWLLAATNVHQKYSTYSTDKRALCANKMAVSCDKGICSCKCPRETRTGSARRCPSDPCWPRRLTGRQADGCENPMSISLPASSRIPLPSPHHEVCSDTSSRFTGPVLGCRPGRDEERCLFNLLCADALINRFAVCYWYNHNAAAVWTVTG